MVDYHYWSLEVLRAEAGNTFTACNFKDSVGKQVQGARQISDKTQEMLRQTKKKKRSGERNIEGT